MYKEDLIDIKTKKVGLLYITYESSIQSSLQKVALQNRSQAFKEEIRIKKMNTIDFFFFVSKSLK